MKIWAFALIASVLLSTSPAAQTHKHKVYIAQFGHDSVAETLAYQLRDEVSKSARYTVVPESHADLRIELVSADLGEAQFRDRGQSSAISFVFTIRSSACADRDWLFLKQGVYLVGNQTISNVAKGILATLDGALSE